MNRFEFRKGEKKIMSELIGVDIFASNGAKMSSVSKVEPKIFGQVTLDEKRGVTFLWPNVCRTTGSDKLNNI